MCLKGYCYADSIRTSYMYSTSTQVMMLPLLATLPHLDFGAAANADFVCLSCFLQVRTPYQLLHMGDPDLEAERNGKPTSGSTTQLPQDAASHQQQHSGNGAAAGQNGVMNGDGPALDVGRGSGHGAGMKLKSSSACEVEPSGAVGQPQKRFKWWGWR